MNAEPNHPAAGDDERVAFEAFLTDCALRFTGEIVPDDLEQVIDAVLTQLVRLCGADRCALLGGAPGQPVSWTTCAVSREAPAPAPANVAGFARAFPWHYAQICAGAPTLVVRTLADLPADAAAVDRRSAQELGIRSMLTAPVRDHASGPHWLVIESLTSERDWPPGYATRLPVLVRILADALSRRRHQQTRQLQLQHADVLESVGVIVWQADARTFQTTFVSREAEAILGYPVESWLRVPDFWLTHIHPDDRAWVEAFSGAAVAQGRDHDFEYRMVVANGRVVWLRNIVKVVVTDGRPSMLVGATVDVTKRREAEFEAAQLRHQLTHAGRVSSLGHLAATLAHELNQPLGAVVSNAEAARLFIDRDAPPGQVRHVLDDIVRDSHRAAGIVRRVRQMLRRETPDVQPLDLAVLVRSVAELVRPLALSRQIDLTVGLEPALPSRGDATEIQQLLLNLIFNAVDAVADQPVSRRHIAVRGARQESEIELSVTDSGPGIPAEARARLFEPFFTTRPDGLGMGLLICRTIAEAHGGRIEVESPADGGAILRAWLPAAAEGESRS